MSFVPIVAPHRSMVDPQDWGPLRDYIHESTGVYYSDSRLSLLVSRLEGRLASTDARGAQDLLLRLRFDETGHELRSLWDLATPHESSFLRERDSLSSMRNELFPELPTDRQLRIWSAGCASGQEAYSIRYAMGISRGRLQILGTDISPRCIAEATRGEYRGTQVRGLGPSDLETLFDNIGGACRVRPEWREGVRFAAHNLIGPADRAWGEMDAIFCRNVLIYFSESARRMAVGHFHETLRDGGYLFLGQPESLHGITRAFRPVTLSHGLVYQKD